MNMNEFTGICSRYTICPLIALENDDVVDTLLSIRDAKDDTAKRGYRNHLITVMEA